MQDITQKLKSLRELNGYTQKDIADILGTTQQTYCNYENSKYEIPVHHITKLSSVYNVTSDYLLGLSSHKSSHPKLNDLFYKNISYGEYIEILAKLSTDNRKSVFDYTQYLLEKQK